MNTVTKRSERADRRKRDADAAKVKTSVALPRELWKAAHMRALDESRDLQDVIAAALAAYLKAGR